MFWVRVVGLCINWYNRAYRVNGGLMVCFGLGLWASVLIGIIEHIGLIVG